VHSSRRRHFGGKPMKPAIYFKRTVDRNSPTAHRAAQASRGAPMNLSNNLPRTITVRCRRRRRQYAQVRQKLSSRYAPIPSWRMPPWSLKIAIAHGSTANSNSGPPIQTPYNWPPARLPKFSNIPHDDSIVHLRRRRGWLRHFASTNDYISNRAGAIANRVGVSRKTL